jgi:hypothetical protein
VLGFWCAGGLKNPRSLSQQWQSNRSTGIIILLINIVSLSPRGRPLATKSAKALQRAAECSSCLLLPLPSPADLIQIIFLIVRLILPCPRVEPATATARRMRSDRAPARKQTFT